MEANRELLIRLYSQKELQQILKDLNLPFTGNKTQLAKRICEFEKNNVKPKILVKPKENC